MKDAILALGMGGPDGKDSIEPFLKNLLSDTDIINFHVGKTLQRFIAGRIAKKRAPLVAPQYGLMGGGSPQLKHTNAFLTKLAQAYKASKGKELDTFVGMCYWHPFIEETLEKIRKEKYRKLYVLPLYPQYSKTTTGACLLRVNKALTNNPLDMPITIFSRFNTFDPYLEALASKVRKAADKLGKDISEVHMLFSAHSLPQYVIDGGDSYVNDLNEEILKLVKILKPASYSLAYQSKLGKMKWLEPRTQDELIRLSQNGVENIVLIAVSFINDHIETLVELDIDIIPEACKRGLNIVRAASFNDDDDFVLAMLKLISQDS